MKRVAFILTLAVCVLVPSVALADTVITGTSRVWTGPTVVDEYRIDLNPYHEDVKVVVQGNGNVIVGELVWMWLRGQNSVFTSCDIGSRTNQTLNLLPLVVKPDGSRSAFSSFGYSAGRHTLSHVHAVSRESIGWHPLGEFPNSWTESPGDNMTYTLTEAQANGVASVLASLYGANWATTQVQQADSTCAAPADMGVTYFDHERIDISWAAVTDPAGISRYEVFLGGSMEASTSATTYTFLGLSADTTYSVGVRAVDGLGNVSNTVGGYVRTDAMPTWETSSTILPPFLESLPGVSAEDSSWFVEARDWFMDLAGRTFSGLFDLFWFFDVLDPR